MILYFSIEGQTLSLDDDRQVISDSQNYLKAKFCFSRDWKNLKKIVQFKRICLFFEKEILEENDNTVIVPWEILQGQGAFYVTVYGVDDGLTDDRGKTRKGKFVTTNGVKVPVGRNGFINDDPMEPSEGLIAQSFLKVQSDWDEKNAKSAAYIKNKPDFEKLDNVVAGLCKQVEMNSSDIKNINIKLESLPRTPVTNFEIKSIVDS